MIIQISSGQGPAECELAVSKLLTTLETDFMKRQNLPKLNRSTLHGVSITVS